MITKSEQSNNNYNKEKIQKENMDKKQINVFQKAVCYYIKK
jgi:hypothetical protein